MMVPMGNDRIVALLLQPGDDGRDLRGLLRVGEACGGRQLALEKTVFVQVLSPDVRQKIVVGMRMMRASSSTARKERGSELGRDGTPRLLALSRRLRPHHQAADCIANAHMRRTLAQ